MIAVDLCAGPGGWDVAARRLGIEVVGIELDSRTCAIRDAAGLATVQGDVSMLDPPAFGPAVGLIASPPCQTFSAGANSVAVKNVELVLDVLQGIADGGDGRAAVATRALDVRDVLVVEPLRWALILEPAWIALEQVPAVLPVWDATAGALEQRGYYCWTGVLNAADYGVPQDRERAILIARRDRVPFPPAPLDYRTRPTDLLPDWHAGDLVGFPRRADRGANVELNGVRYRTRDLRDAGLPTFTLTSKARSWVRLTGDGEVVRVELAELVALQGFPADYPFDAAGSRSAAVENLANTVPPPLAQAVLQEVVA